MRNGVSDEARFFDSSALLKRYLKEQGSQRVLNLTDPEQTGLILISGLTPIEMIATLRRQGRQGGTITSEESDRAVRSFQHDLEQYFIVIDLTPQILKRAVEVANTHALRGSDSIQLAAVLDVRDRMEGRGLPPPSVISSDRELNIAATQEGLVVENPENHT